MKCLRTILAAFVAVVCLAGCLQVERVVKLKPDGSGTIEETVLLSPAGLANFRQMAAGAGAHKAGGGKVPDFFDESRLEDAAAKMGEGVTFVSAKKISSDQGEGFTAIYAFSDINKLQLDQTPTEALPSGGKIGVSDTSKKPILFHFAKGSPAELAVSLPPPEFKPKKEQDAGREDMAMQMMKQMFKDFRISLAIEVAGTIGETNAEYRDGSRVTLMDLDFNKVLADPEKFKALARANPQTLQEAKALMKGLEGVKIETAPEVKIKFQ